MLIPAQGYTAADMQQNDQRIFRPSLGRQNQPVWVSPSKVSVIMAVYVKDFYPPPFPTALRRLHTKAFSRPHIIKVYHSCSCDTIYTEKKGERV